MRKFSAVIGPTPKKICLPFAGLNMVFKCVLYVSDDLVRQNYLSAPECLGLVTWKRAVDNPLLYRSSRTRRRPGKKGLRNEEL